MCSVFQRKVNTASLSSRCFNRSIQEGEYDDDLQNLWNVHSQNNYMLRNRNLKEIHAKCNYPSFLSKF